MRIDFILKCTYNYVHMETDYRKLISDSPAPFFTRRNLEILLGRNRRTLDYRITSLVKNGLLARLKSGWYINYALYQKTSSPEELARYIGCEVVRESYISLEYALAAYGVLAENVYTMTYVTTQKTRKYQNDFLRLTYRNIKPSLFWGYARRQYGDLSYRIASSAKAMFDLLYLTPLNSDSAIREFLFNSRFNWDVMNKADKAEFRESVVRSGSNKMTIILRYLKEKEIV